MLWVLKRNVSMREGSFAYPKHMLEIMGKKIFTILRREKFCLSKPMYTQPYACP